MGPPPNKLVEYYAARAQEYDDIYAKPERQADLALLRQMLTDLLAGYRVLEIACGTGYWTQLLAEHASSVVAVDVNPEMISVAHDRVSHCENVRIVQDDAYRLAGIQGPYSAGFAGFWWSHIGRDDLGHFLDIFHSKLEPDARVVFIDNAYAPGSSQPITSTDDRGNTYQRRRLASGAEYTIIKNFPEEGELRSILGPWSSNLRCEFLQYYWFVSYNLIEFDETHR